MDLTTLAAHLGLDLAAVSLLTFGVFCPRHRRRELVPAYLALNVALFAVVAALSEASGGGGLALGFGLFGVLSIVRLRSDAVRHQEVAYYFITLVLGLLCGLPGLSLPMAAGLAAVLLLVMYVGDHPRLYRRDRRALVTLDAVYREEDALRAELARRLGEPLGGGWGSRSAGRSRRSTTYGTSWCWKSASVSRNLCRTMGSSYE
ncbi:hypothetical protein STRAU_0586 [Streptomyces aurantiacus JA 4570]|uniref:DUF4956 domain-containing protein n=1 Tax=Streptomyces aurantiacus JA 4570 TaxID=1286094 RepID=S3ZSC5_9ACTN|nr:DUF4956 domain-containing protein [Streptomyces aurantiacus]EPH46336.1 hypothetical protein STRAU_0586 [Streptomyces aurantiacus JA 4570]